MTEQLTLDGSAESVDVTRRRLGVLLTGTACTLPHADWRPLDALVEHEPVSYPVCASAGVLLFDPMPPATELRVREWAAKHRVQLWEGRL